MPARFLLLGTNHPLQCGASDCTVVQIEMFQQYLRDLCKGAGVRLVTEEASADGLKRLGVAETVAARVVRELGIQHRMVDLCLDERISLGISDGQLSGIAMKVRKPGVFDLSPLRQQLDSLSVQIREATWVARTLNEKTWPGLVIVGADHVKSVAKLFRKCGQTVVVAHADYEP